MEFHQVICNTKGHGELFIHSTSYALLHWIKYYLAICRSLTFPISFSTSVMSNGMRIPEGRLGVSVLLSLSVWRFVNRSGVGLCIGGSGGGGGGGGGGGAGADGTDKSAGSTSEGLRTSCLFSV